MIEPTDQPLLETWAIHDRINRYLLAAIPDDAMSASMTGRGRTVQDLFAHIHNIRLMWLKASAPDLLATLEKIDPKAPFDRDGLNAALTQSGLAVSELLQRAFLSGGQSRDSSRTQPPS